MQSGNNRENPFDRIDSQSSVCPLVCFHVIGSALLWADTGNAKNFDTPFGRFEYTHISKAAFSVGLTSIKKDGYAFVMATPEKALCDLIANSSKVNLRYLKDAEIYLEEDIRMEREDFMQMDARLFGEYIKVGKKADSIRTLLKLLKK